MRLLHTHGLCVYNMDRFCGSGLQPKELSIGACVNLSSRKLRLADQSVQPCCAIVLAGAAGCPCMELSGWASPSASKWLMICDKP